MTKILHDNVIPVVAVVTEDIAEYHQADKASINQLVTTSQIVAAYFEKKHCDVLRIINNIKTQFCVLTSSQSPKSDFDSMFYVASYESGTGKRYKMYFMTRDGFSLLAMGFTGKKALEWKIKYIQAFNEMERKLKEQGMTKNGHTPKHSSVNSKTPDVAPPEVLAQARAKTMLMNARTRQAKLWKELADESTGIYQEVCKVYAANILAGKEVLPLPAVKGKTLTATQIGEMLGISALNVGRLANKHNLKTDSLGKWHYDVLKNGKQVETFRYYESAVPVFRELLQAEKADRELRDKVSKMSIGELLGDIILVSK